MIGRPGELDFDIRETFQWSIDPDGQVVRWDVAFINERGAIKQYGCQAIIGSVDSVDSLDQLAFVRETARRVLRRIVNREAEQMHPLHVPNTVVSRLI